MLVLNELRLGQVYGENASYSDENDMKANFCTKKKVAYGSCEVHCGSIVYPLCQLRHEKNTDEICSFSWKRHRLGPGGSDIALGSNKSLCCLQSCS